MKNRVFLLSVALVAILTVALNQQSNPIVSWFAPAEQAEAQAASRTFAGEGGDAARFFFIEKGIKPFQDGVAIDDTPLTTQKICELAGYSRVAYLTTRNFASCGDNFVETWNGSTWVRSGACSTQPYIDTLTCDTPIVTAADLSISRSGPSTVTLGNTVTYSTTVTNNGPSAATNIVVTETIPNSLNWFMATTGGSGVTCTSNATTTTCTIASLNANQSISYTVSYPFNQGQSCPASLQSQASVTSSISDPNMNNNTSNIVTTTVSCQSSNVCRVATFEASNGSLTNQGWTELNPSTNQSVQTLTENGITFLRINDQSTTQGLRTEFTNIPDSALADRDWTLEMKARIHNSTENGYVIGMNMLLTSPAGKYASIYIDTDKFGPIGTSINQYNYARTHSTDTTNGFHTYTIRYKKNGAGVNDDTFDVLFDGQVVMANVARTEIWDSGVWNQNINGISFGVGSSPGQAQMDVQYVRFRNTDSNNCPSSSSSSSLSSSSSSLPTTCKDVSYNAAHQTLPESQNWQRVNRNAGIGDSNATATIQQEGSTRYLRLVDQSTSKGIGFEHQGVTAADMQDRDWRFEITTRINASANPTHPVGMNHAYGSDGERYFSLYMEPNGFGPAGPGTPIFTYGTFVPMTLSDRFHTIVIENHKNGPGVADDTQNFYVDGNLVISNYQRSQNYPPLSTEHGYNDALLAFGNLTSGGTGAMDVTSVRFRNTDSNNCPGSSSSSSSSSQQGTFQCSNGVDDDNDGQIDNNDPGCHTDRNRFNPLSYNPYGNEFDNNRSYTCQDGVDNNNNGLIDAQDPICHTDGNPNNPGSYNPNGNEGFASSSSSSSSSAGFAQCSNGVDDDADNLIDNNDPGCHTDRNRFNPASYNPNGTESNNDRTRGCQDGIDNNGNGLIDAQDPICHTDGNPNNPGSFDPNRNEDGNNQGNGCVIIKTRAEDEDGDRIEDDLPAFTVTLDGGIRSVFTDDDGDARFNNVSNGSHSVSMQLFGDWELDSISPSNGNVNITGTSCKTVTFNITETDNDDDDDDDNDDDDAEVEVRKTAGSSEVFPGGTIEYMITIENTGDVDLENLMVEDRIPSDLTILDDGDADDRDGNELTWEIDIDEGDTETIRYRVAVPTYMYPGQTIRNDVRVTSDDDNDDIDIDENASAFITVIGTLPQTGMLGMVSNASAYLTPVSQAAASSSSGMGTAAAAATTILSGIGGGIAIGRKYLGL